MKEKSSSRSSSMTKESNLVNFSPLLSIPSANIHLFLMSLVKFHQDEINKWETD